MPLLCRCKKNFPKEYPPCPLSVIMDSQLFPPARQRFTGFRVGRGNIEIERLQGSPAAVPDFMGASALDEEQRAAGELVASAADHRAAGPGDNIEPLIAPAVPVVGTPFRLPRRKDHGCRLGAFIADLD